MSTLTETGKKSLRTVLNRLKTAHLFYSAGGMEEKQKILDAMEPTFKSLEVDYDDWDEYGHAFGILYVLYGDRFLKEEKTIGVQNMDEYIQKVLG